MPNGEITGIITVLALHSLHYMYIQRMKRLIALSLICCDCIMIMHEDGTLSTVYSRPYADISKSNTPIYVHVLFLRCSNRHT